MLAPFYRAQRTTQQQRGNFTMKGIVHAVFNQLVEEKFGLETWDHLLDTVKPASDGVYTSVDSYEDGELMTMVKVLSEHSGVPINDLVFTFGEYTLTQLAQLYPVFFVDKTLKDFLLSIHDVVHVEVKKLFENSSPPDFRYEDPGPDQLVMLYQSPRKLCRLAEGLIQGSAQHFHTPCTIAHPLCMHKGDDHCRLELQLGSPHEQ